jgi:hypothetical protein
MTAVILLIIITRLMEIVDMYYIKMKKYTLQ